MKKLLLIMIAIAMCTVTANAQNRDINSLLTELDALSNTPLSMDIVIQQNFSPEEQDILNDYFASLQSVNPTGSNTESNHTYYVFNVRGGANDFGTMDSTPPFSINTILAPMSVVVFADDFDENGVLYGLEFGDAPLSRDLVTVNTSDGTVTVIGDLITDMGGATPTGLAYDFTTNTMYGTSGNILYTIDLVAGSATMVGPMTTITSIWLVIDNDGNAYAADISDDTLHSVDLTTGTSAIIGPLGVDIGFAQEATVNPEDNVIYMAAYTGGGTGGIYSVDPATGAATLIGDTTPLNAELTMFSVEGTPPLSVNENNLSIVSIYPNPANDVVFIETTVPGTKLIEVYDVLGKLVLNTSIEDSELNVSSLSAGNYMVRVTQNNNTATKKLVVR